MMHFYVIMRRETGNFITKLTSGVMDETPFVSRATRYTTRKRAIAHMGPNTCVCGPYPTDEYVGGQPG